MAVQPQVDPAQVTIDPDRPQLAQIQGNVVPGFLKDVQDFIFVRFPGEAEGRAWLGMLQSQITTADKVALAHQQFLASKTANNSAATPKSGPWVNVALSYAGLDAINAKNRGRFPRDFTSTSTERAARLSDFGRGFDQWPIGGRTTEPHAVLIIGGDTETDVMRMYGLITGVEVLPNGICRGRSLGTGREHFGFKDGLSQPDPANMDDLAHWLSTNDGRVVAPGEFVLGYRDESGNVPQMAPQWAVNGSFLVFRQFKQDVAAFDNEMKRCAAELQAGGVQIDETQLAAEMLGRTKDGQLLASADFSDDPEGRKCPWFAHVRKANPRDQKNEEPDKHRIIRRGITYGGVDDADKGMLFVCYQASIERQFEQIYNQWLGASTFPTFDRPVGVDPTTNMTKFETPGLDPMTGWTAIDQTGKIYPRDVNLRVGQLPTDFQTLSLAAFTSVKASGYFFAPSVAALAELSGHTEAVMNGIAV